ncbi:hypothetical protein LR69_01065 [Geobacillus sp. BCO2]|nr:hypothetical protein LR69_01065 [Geobacillus sp. BCO2]
MKQHRLSFELEMVVERAYECIKLTGRLAYDTQLAAEQNWRRPWLLSSAALSLSM